jgi:hypothetical protein
MDFRSAQQLTVASVDECHSVAATRLLPVAKRRKLADKFIAVRVASTVVPGVAACRLQMKGWVIECSSLPPPAWLAGLMAGDADAVP